MEMAISLFVMFMQSNIERVVALLSVAGSNCFFVIHFSLGLFKKITLNSHLNKTSLF
jgi:hypothetical protein